MTVNIIHRRHPRISLSPGRKRKGDRDFALLAYDKAHPRATLEEMGKQFGISGERVRQILRSRGVATRKQPYKYTCKTCRRTLKAQTKGGNCLACLMQANRITLVCAICGIVFQRLLSLHDRPKHPRKLKEAFCSRRCFGVFLGKHNTKDYCIRGHLLAETRTKNGCRLCINERARLRCGAQKVLAKV